MTHTTPPTLHTNPICEERHRTLLFGNVFMQISLKKWNSEGVLLRNFNDKTTTSTTLSQSTSLNREKLCLFDFYVLHSAKIPFLESYKVYISSFVLELPICILGIYYREFNCHVNILFFLKAKPAFIGTESLFNHFASPCKISKKNPPAHPKIQ